MKPSLVAPLAVALAALTVPTASAATCKPLTDATSPFTTFIKTHVDADSFGSNHGINDLLRAFESIDTELPWLSTCLGSIDAASVYATVSVSSGYATCDASITSFLNDNDLAKNLFEDNALRLRLCPFYGTKVMPCINNVGVHAVVDAMAAAGSCCDAARTKIKTYFGVNVKTMVADLLNKVGETMCTVKTSTKQGGETKMQTCFGSMYEAAASSGMDTVAALAQLPTGQACKAMAGQAFQTTTFKTAQLAATWGYHEPTPVEPIGICYEPMSELLKLVAAYPVMATTMTTVDGAAVSMADMFTVDKCMLINNVVAWLQDAKGLPMQWARALNGPVYALRLLGWLAGEDDSEWTELPIRLSNAAKNIDLSETSVCVHLATGQKCTYTGVTTALAYTAPAPAPSPADETPASTTPTPAATTPAPTTATTKAESSAAAVFVGVALVVASAVAYMAA